MKVSRSAEDIKEIAQEEISMLEYLRTSAPDHADRQKIVQLLDHFKVSVVNGVRKFMICSH